MRCSNFEKNMSNRISAEQSLNSIGIVESGNVLQ